MQEVTADREGAIVAVMGTHLLSFSGLKRFNPYTRGVYSRSQNVVKQKWKKWKKIDCELRTRPLQRLNVYLNCLFAVVVLEGTAFRRGVLSRQT
jgi:hypothetical protein